MGKLTGFLRLCTVLLFCLFTNNLMASFTCNASGYYISCKDGYYLSDCGTTYDGRTITSFSTGNNCLPCPDGLVCSGNNAVCPKAPKITFAKGSGSGTVPAAIYCTAGTSCSLSTVNASTSFYRPGYKLVGWSTSSTATTATYTTTGTFSADTTLYPVWTACEAGTYHKNGTGTAANTCTKCSGTTYQDATGQTSCKSCPAPTVGSVYNGWTVIDRIGYNSTEHTTITQCWHRFSKETTAGTIYTNCYADSTGTYGTSTASCDGFSGTICNAGYYYNGTRSYKGFTNVAANVCKAVSDGSYFAGGTVSGYTAQTPSACKDLDSSKTDGTYSSVSPRSASTNCRFTQNQQTVPTYCATKKSNMMSYTGSAWPANTYSVTAKAGSIISGNNTASATCSQCSGGKYSSGGTTTSCSTISAGCYGGAGSSSSCPNSCPSSTYPNSAAGATAQTQCYANVTLHKNGFSGTITANTGTGCKVASTATGTTNATLRVYYNTACTFPTISSFSQTGYTAASDWSASNTLGGTAVTSLAASTSKPTSTYYVRKTTCAANNYKSSTTACSTCSSGTSSKYTLSAAGTASDINVCYLNTTSKNYVKTAGAGQVSCDEGGYCPGSVKVYYGGTHSDTHLTTGGRTTCAANSTSDAGSDAISDCKCKAGYSGDASISGGTCTACTKGKYKGTAGNTTCTSATSGQYVDTTGAKTYKLCSSLDSNKTDGTYSSVSPYDASTTCRFTQNQQTVPTYCATKKSNMMSYTGSAWPANTYSVTAKAGSIISGNNTASATCSQCSGGKYSSGGTTTSCGTIKSGCYGGAGSTSDCPNQCPANSYCPAGSSTHTLCTSLGGGWYKNSAAGSDAATDCYRDLTSGYYFDSETTATSAPSSCTAGNYCKGGRYFYSASATGEIGITPCPANSYCPAGSSTHTLCKSIPQTYGKYPYSPAGSDAATDCYMTLAAGKYFTSATSATETPYDCTAGYYCAGGNFYYNASATNIGITQCPANSYCPAGSANHTLCTSLGGGLYKYSNAGSTKNGDCYFTTTGGYYITNSTDPAQTKCDANYYCPATKLNYPNVGSKQSCPDPSVDTYKEKMTEMSWLSSRCPGANSSNSSIYSASYEVRDYNNTGLSAITQCVARYYVETPCARFTGETVKYNSSTGRYDTDTTSVYTSGVKKGYYLTGKFSDAYCNVSSHYMLYRKAVECPANSYCPGGDVPRCDNGTYNESWGANACTSLGAFYTTSPAGANANTACSGKTTPGKFIENAKDANEKTCTAGGYCPGNVTVYYGSTGGKTLCDAGKYSASTGASSSSVCTACALGSYTNSKGNASCTACAAGNTTATTGATSCTPCANNNDYDNAWADPSWSANKVTNLCKITNCKAGSKYSSAAGTNTTGSCTACGLGTYMSSTAHTNTTCTSAAAGYYVNTTGASSAKACSGKTYQDLTGQTECKSCPNPTAGVEYRDGWISVDSSGYNGTDPHTTVTRCWHRFSNSNQTTANIIYTNCYADSNQTYGTSTVPCDGFTSSSCKPGYYYDGTHSYKGFDNTAANVCKAVGSGKYYAGGTVTRGVAQTPGTCATGLTTCGAGLCANEAEDCGRKFNIEKDGKTRTFYLRSDKRTWPSLNFSINNQMFYGNLVEGTATSGFHVSDGTTNYTLINDNQ